MKPYPLPLTPSRQGRGKSLSRVEGREKICCWFYYFSLLSTSPMQIHPKDQIWDNQQHLKKSHTGTSVSCRMVKVCRKEKARHWQANPFMKNIVWHVMVRKV